MKAVCINNTILYQDRLAPYITIGKIYNIQNSAFINCYRIIDDRGLHGDYVKSRFKALDEWRNKKLEELGI